MDAMKFARQYATLSAICFAELEGAIARVSELHQRSNMGPAIKRLSHYKL